MQIGIIGGHGKMGKIINEMSLKRGHQTFIINTKDEWNYKVDVLIDFSVNTITLANVELANRYQIPIVIGTTGWLNQKEAIANLVNQSNNTVVYSGNFSLGVNLFWQTLKQACINFAPFANNYDCFIHEIHHNEKKDSPSGTALSMGQIILENFPSKQKILSQNVDRAINPDELNISSSRGGKIFGIHTAYFDSEFDTIEITHNAKNRQGFALGAVLTAENIKKLSPGFYSLSEVFDQIFTS